MESQLFNDDWSEEDSCDGGIGNIPKLSKKSRPTKMKIKNSPNTVGCSTPGTN